MFYKLLTIIVALGLIGVVLLVTRQQRIDAAHDMADTHRRLIEHETKLWRMRAEVVRRCRPEDIRSALEQSDISWQPISNRPAPQTPAGDQLATDEPSPRRRDTLIEG